MKKLGLYVLMMVWLCACDGLSTKESASDEVEKATAILWVDRNGDEKLTKYGSISTVKVYANVYSDGTFRILSYYKRQEKEVIEYLNKRVAVFTIPRYFFDEGYIKPGKQYLQLRYIPAKVWSPYLKPGFNKKNLRSE